MKQYVNTLPAGSVLDSGQHRYRIVKVLGQGGFGITYQAMLGSVACRTGSVMFQTVVTTTSGFASPSE